jgi:hypothetical protein
MIMIPVHLVEELAGAAGGRASNPAKAAARRNGCRGGRPPRRRREGKAPLRIESPPGLAFAERSVGTCRGTGEARDGTDCVLIDTQGGGFERNDARS